MSQSKSKTQVCKGSTRNQRAAAPFLEPQGLDMYALSRVMWRERKSCYTLDLCVSSMVSMVINCHVWSYECIDLHFALLLWSVQRKLSLQLLLHILWRVGCTHASSQALWSRGVAWIPLFLFFHSIFSNFISDFPTSASHVPSSTTINCRTVMAYPL